MLGVGEPDAVHSGAQVFKKKKKQTDVTSLLSCINDMERIKIKQFQMKEDENHKAILASY